MDHELKSEYRGDIHMLLPLSPHRNFEMPRHHVAAAEDFCGDGGGLFAVDASAALCTATSDFYTEPACYLAPASRISDECRWAAWA